MKIKPDYIIDRTIKNRTLQRELAFIAYTLFVLAFGMWLGGLR